MARNNKLLPIGLIPWLLSDPKTSSKVSDFFLGSPDTFEKLPTGTPEQEGLHKNVLSQAMNMSDGGGYDLANQYFNSLIGENRQQAYDQFSAPYLQQFEEQMLPRIAERFAGVGALSSSGFAQSLSSGASNLQAQLAQVFSQLQGNAAQNQYNQYNQLAQTGLNYQPFAYNQKEGSAGFLAPLLAAGGTALGGPIGGVLGHGVGKGISSLYKNSRGGGLS